MTDTSGTRRAPFPDAKNGNKYTQWEILSLSASYSKKDIVRFICASEYGPSKSMIHKYFPTEKAKVFNEDEIRKLLFFDEIGSPDWLHKIQILEKSGYSPPTEAIRSMFGVNSDKRKQDSDVEDARERYLYLLHQYQKRQLQQHQITDDQPPLNQLEPTVQLLSLSSPSQLISPQQLSPQQQPPPQKQLIAQQSASLHQPLCQSQEQQPPPSQQHRYPTRLKKRKNLPPTEEATTNSLSQQPLRRSARTYDGKFIERCNLLREFIYYRERFPHQSSTDRNESDLFEFMGETRSLWIQSELSETKVHLINEIHSGILRQEGEYCYKTPSANVELWQSIFDELRRESNQDDVEAYIFASTGEPVVLFNDSKSLKEFMIKKLGYQNINPSDCHKEAADASIQHVVSYLIDSHTPTSEEMTSGVDYIPTIVEGYPNPHYHSHNGSYFPPDSQPPIFHQLLRAVIDEDIFPNNLFTRLKACTTPASYLKLESENQHLFDTFHFPEGGCRFNKPVPIMQSSFSQARRIGFSVINGSPRFFPTLGAHCQLLFSYGAYGRNAADVRCRPMPSSLYNLVVAAWKHVRSRLDPLSQLCPPTNVQVLVYSQINELNSKGKVKATYQRNIGLHKDNGYRKPNNVRRGVYNNVELNSHTEGTSVMTINYGDEMEFLLVCPDTDKDEDYHTMTTEKAKEYCRRQENDDSLKLVTKILMEGGSIKIHSAHDDEMYHHGAEFSKPDNVGTKVRIALVCRWLSAPAYFRCDPNDDPNKRFSCMGKVALEKLRTRGDAWIKATGNDQNSFKVLDPLHYSD